MDDKPILSPFELNKDPIKLEKQKEVIFNYFDGEGKLSFNNLLDTKTRLEVIVTFLAILDLVKGILRFISSGCFFRYTVNKS